jgi:hypothetical protein
MVDDRLADAESSPEVRAKRPGPTIELEASEVSSATKPAPEGQPAPETVAEPEPESAAAPSADADPAGPAPAARPISPWVIAPFSGAVAAALVIGVGWMLGWPQVSPTPQAPQVQASTVDDLAKRVAALEDAIKPVAAGSGALQKQVGALRDDVATLRTQSGKLASEVEQLTSAPRDASGAVDLSGLNERIDKLERASGAAAAQIAAAQQSEKAVDAKPADDKPLRLVVAAALLDVAVRHGDPYAAELAAAKSLSPNADALTPLDAFAATGVPNPPLLSRELLALVPKLAPSAQDNAAAGGIIARLQAGAERLVKVERTDAVGSDRRAVVARATAAALRNDVTDATRELDSLSPADRAAAQGWLDKVKARDAALAASRQFVEQSMASLAQPGQ